MGDKARCKCDDVFQLDEVCNEELKIIAARRKRIMKRVRRNGAEPAEPAKTLVGLALSGGGIRSAATNLGILQGLSKSGILQFVDYLSTVSGGGYIGSCLASLLSNNRSGTCKNGKRPYQFASESDDSEALFTTSWETFPFRDDHTSWPARQEELSGMDQMEHIRSRASYLTPRPRYLSDTLMRAVGAVTFTTLTPFLWFLLMVALLTSLYMGIVPFLAPEMTVSSDPPHPRQVTMQAVVGLDGTLKLSYKMEQDRAQEKKSLAEKAEAAWNTIRHHGKQPFVDLEDNIAKMWLPFVVAGLLMVLLLWVFLRCRPENGGKPEHQDRPPPDSEVNRKRFGQICWVIFISLLVVIGLSIADQLMWKIGSGKGAMLLLPGIFLLGAYLASSMVAVYVSRFKERDGCWTRENRTIINMCQGACFAGLLFTLVLALLPGLILASNAVFVACVQVPLAFGLKSFLAGQNKKKSEKKGKKISDKFKNWLLGFLVPLIVLLAVIWVGSVIAPPAWPAQISVKPWLWPLATAGLLIVFSLLVDVNKVSPHYFYRDRLIEAFLRTFGRRCLEEPECGHVCKRDNTEMRLTQLHGVWEEDAGKCMGRGPYLLVNATLNLTASHDLKGFNRKAEVFTFSRSFVGAERTGYMRTQEYEGGELKLARAMTISGAAATSVMGANTSPLASFASTILGVRLGYWLTNISACRWGSFWQKLYKRFPATGRLLQELTSYTNVRGPEIYLSDGGHSGDNLGILPLLRRRAKVIIASDAECDPDHAFDSFNSSVRQAYVDEGIKISISLKDIYRNEDGRSEKHYAVGRILYPDRPWQRSWIIIVKNTMTKGEIAPILNYQHKHPAFPHESTGDQFFTEEQFESYRALGRHAAEEACRELFPWSEEVKTQARLSASDEGKEPWTAVLESICRRLKMRDASDRWDDLLVAMWEAEQGGFADWGSFKSMLECHAVTLACLACQETKNEFYRKRGSVKDFLGKYSAGQARSRQICEQEQAFWSLYRFVASPGFDPEKLRKDGPVPRSMAEFRAFKRKASRDKN